MDTQAKGQILSMSRKEKIMTVLHSLPRHQSVAGKSYRLTSVAVAQAESSVTCVYHEKEASQEPAQPLEPLWMQRQRRKKQERTLLRG